MSRCSLVKTKTNKPMLLNSSKSQRTLLIALYTLTITACSNEDSFYDPTTGTMNEFNLKSEPKEVILRIRDYTSNSENLFSLINQDSVAHFTDYYLIVSPGDTTWFQFHSESFRYQPWDTQPKAITVDVYFEDTPFAVHFRDTINKPYIIFN